MGAITLPSAIFIVPRGIRYAFVRASLVAVRRAVARAIGSQFIYSFYYVIELITLLNGAGHVQKRFTGPWIGIFSPVLHNQVVHVGMA